MNDPIQREGSCPSNYMSSGTTALPQIEVKASRNKTVVLAYLRREHSNGSLSYPQMQMNFVDWCRGDLYEGCHRPVTRRCTVVLALQSTGHPFLDIRLYANRASLIKFGIATASSIDEKSTVIRIPNSL